MKLELWMLLKLEESKIKYVYSLNDLWAQLTADENSAPSLIMVLLFLYLSKLSNFVKSIAKFTCLLTLFQNAAQQKII